MATTFLKVANGAVSTTAGAINNSSDPVTFSVASGEGSRFPSSFPFHITIDSEILSCTARSTDSLTCSRAQQGTTIASHSSGAAVELRVTAKSVSDLNTAVNTVETSLASTTGSGSFVLDSSPTIVTPTIASLTNAQHSHQNAAGGGTLDHGLALTGLTDDDHTQYGLLAGRSGGQTLIGGTGSGDTLTLKPTSSSAAGANLILDLSVHQSNQIVPQLATTLTAAQTAFSLASGQTIAVNASGGARAFGVSGTWNINAAPNASMFIGFQFNPTVHLTASGAALRATNVINVGGSYDINAAVSLSTDAGPFNGLKFAPNFSNAAAGGTQTITAVSGVDTIPIFDTGWTVTTYRGLRVQKPTGSGTITTLVGVDIADLAARATNNFAFRAAGLNDTSNFAGPVNIGTNSGNTPLATSSAPILTLNRSETIAGTVTDGQVAALQLTPTYDAASSQTITRHNYINLIQPAVTGSQLLSGMTDACVFRFDAAAGTHKAVDGNTTKTSPGTVSAWVKININGTVHYMPAYTSKTS